MPMIYKFTV